jgi:predicted nuclease of predicted toxin-antitoxin system
VKLLLDEMYPVSLAERLREADIEARTVTELRLAGSSDPEVFAAATVLRHALLTENVQDFAAIAAEHSAAGGHHPGILIALSNRFSRRAAGQPAIVAAIQAVQGDPLEDRVIYLERQSE